MENLLANAFNTGDIKIIAVAVILYLVIHYQRKDTSKKRDTEHTDLSTRVALLEHDNEYTKTQQNVLSQKLDSIMDILTKIQVELAKKEEKK